MIDYLINGYNVIYIDESSFINNHKSFKTWLNPTEDRTRSYPGRFKSTSLIVAISTDGVLHYNKNFSTNKATDFLEFFKKLHEKVKEKEELKNVIEKNKIVYYMDNAPIHCTKELIEFYEKNNIKVIYGIPYNPEINVAEYFFKIIKQVYFKRIFKNK